MRSFGPPSKRTLTQYQSHLGTFHLLPFGLRVQEKIERLLDNSMRGIGKDPQPPVRVFMRLIDLSFVTRCLKGGLVIYNVERSLGEEWKV